MRVGGSRSLPLALLVMAGVAGTGTVLVRASHAATPDDRPGAPAAAPETQPQPPNLEGVPLEVLARQCREAVSARSITGLRLVQAEVLRRRPDPPSSEAVLRAAEVLLACEAPDGALDMLSRHSPARGPDRQAWLLLQWRAADAGQDHERAAQALRWLAEGDLTRLERLTLSRVSPLDGSVSRRPALDQLADHLESLGQPRQAAEVLLAGKEPGERQAGRLGRAVALAETMEPGTRDALLEQALEQAAASGAWGLVADLLDQQLALVSGGTASGLSPAAAQALERRLRLSGRIDDAYGEWLLQRRFPLDPDRRGDLETQLRSPRDSGGHAADPDSPSHP